MEFDCHARYFTTDHGPTDKTEREVLVEAAGIELKGVEQD